MNSKFLKRILKSLPDGLYISCKYFYHEHRFPNLFAPKGFNEKIQWLKLHDRKKEYATFVDKHEVKKYVSDTIGAEYVITEYGVWDSFDDINFDKLPNKFVLKTTHDCGGVLVCKNKAKLNISEAKKFIDSHLNTSYYEEGREWPYKLVKPRIIAEELLVDPKISECSEFEKKADGLVDYKFYCFNGEPKFLYIAFANIINGEKHDLLSFLNMDWTAAPFYRKDHKAFPIKIEKPACFNEMVDISRKLSKGIPFVRVDLYEINGRIYFSELTLSPGSGFGCFYPKEWEKKIGEWIDLKSCQ